MLSMDSIDNAEGGIQVQRTMIDFASQMEALNRQGIEVNEEPALALTQSQKELRMINMNREAIKKRNEMVQVQNADIESSFDSS